MALILKTKNFLIEAHPQPEVGREDGGHIVISPIEKFADRTELSAELAKEMVLLTIITGKAMKEGLAEQGIHLGRINYQENGNWRPELHVHLYGRALDAKYHPFGHPIKSAWTAAEKVIQEPLNMKDVELIKKYMLLHAKDPGFREVKFVD
jgi:diadenosine tetraphosphate (Ap4A) HIT family hydrolase